MNMQELATEALLMQDGSNIHGLAKSYPDRLWTLKKLLEAEGKFGNNYVEAHPVNRMWVSKLADMSGFFIDSDVWLKAYEECKQLANDEVMGETT